MSITRDDSQAWWEQYLSPASSPDERHRVEQAAGAGWKPIWDDAAHAWAWHPPGGGRAAAPASPAAPTAPVAPGAPQPGSPEYQAAIEAMVASDPVLNALLPTYGRQRRDQVLAYGDASGVPGIDQNTADAARANPFSVVKALQKQQIEGRLGATTTASAHGLSMGGVSQALRNRQAMLAQQRSYESSRSLQENLNSIADQEARSRAEAYQRAMANPPGLGSAPAAPPISGAPGLPPGATPPLTPTGGPDRAVPGGAGTFFDPYQPDAPLHGAGVPYRPMVPPKPKLPRPVAAPRPPLFHVGGRF